MQDADKGPQTEIDGRNLRIGIVQARWNAEITRTLAQSCIAELQELGVSTKYIRHVTVPGALEIPVVLMTMADSEDYDALIALGCVIRGETYHFDIVSNESSRALMDLAVSESLAIGNGILTVENDEQAWARARRSDKDKGGFAARAALTMIELKKKLGA